LKYDDLLNVPYKAHGRSKEEGFDCYGLAVEMCRRAGTPLVDMYDLAELPAERTNDYIRGGVNVRRINTPKTGALAECVYRGNLHVAYIVGDGLAIHATYDKGIRVSPPQILKPVAFYEVIDASSTIQKPFKQRGIN
jgi:cell wall-associated NlpC family hydrolase